MDEINGDMPQADVALIIGANDVVNPAARTDKTSPIYGMPIIDADKAKTIYAIKRSKAPGFAGIDNELYFLDKTFMLFGDAKAVVGELAKHLAEDGGHDGIVPQVRVPLSELREHVASSGELAHENAAGIADGLGRHVLVGALANLPRRRRRRSETRPRIERRLRS